MSAGRAYFHRPSLASTSVRSASGPAVKATGVAGENAKLLAEFKKNAEARYKAGQGQQRQLHVFGRH